ncbi:NTF2 fold immunity protein [Niabella hibiscisoli]|uniref:NTF2 fold immunity protein n=1 Tax=Niabella hibiscisoli TaxID=1825928 RepID=UPI001F10A4B0|nr:NTF2 fold immunity protein [Niabella hibiscisoli]MCH5717767.1 YbbC/YhhH family protein [Niabella hibiscisoli]
MKHPFLIGTAVLCFFLADAQNKGRSALSEELALATLEKSLKDSTAFNVIDNKSVFLKDSSTVLKLAEAILFSVYGEALIVKQKPYKLYHPKNYWIITGTLPGNVMFAGVFYIAIDDRNGKIVRLVHGK